MKHINILPPDLVSKIAAGEVIERPASVVKELLENALDASATAIEIGIRQAGRSSIRVKDNGSGISAEDIENVFHRHATSKLTTLDDLFAIGSFGFRGEALYSIAAVADVLLRSKTANADSGWEVHVRGGEKISSKPIGMQQGTELEIQELFFNTPARRKFLKRNATEFNQILATITPYTLVHPTCSFKFTTDYHAAQRTVLNLGGVHTILERVSAVLNLEAEHIIELQETISDRNIHIEAYLGDTNIRRTSRDMQYVFVNGRPVYQRLLTYRLNELYRLIFPADIYPFFIILLTVPLESVDVNVHPTKREVKIQQEYDVCAFIKTLCEEALLSRAKTRQITSFTPATQADFPCQGSGGTYAQGEFRPTASHIADASAPEYKTTTATQNVLEQVLPSQPQELQAALKHKLQSATYIGAFHYKYLIFETPESLLFIDQHAAQERITFETLLAQIENVAVEVQRLLTPVLISVSQQEMLQWEELTSALESIGFATSAWDAETVAIHAHPTLIKQPDIAVRSILAGLEGKQYDRESLARRACRQSVMAGDTIAKVGAEQLRENLIQCKDPFTCPHGRPTVIEMAEKFLNKQFLRS